MTRLPPAISSHLLMRLIGLAAMFAFCAFAPRATEGQQTGKVYRVGYLSLGSESASLPETSGIEFNGLRRGLRDLGWTEGGNLIIEGRWTEGKSERLLPLPLPTPIELFMSSENTHDLEALADCFAAHATVRDEGQTLQGLKAIQAWRLETRKKYRHTVEPVAVTARDGKTVVSTKLTGDFPGSPITLDFVFTLEGGKIAVLEIQS